MKNSTVIHVISGLQQAGAETLLFRLLGSSQKNDSTEHIVLSLTTLGYYGKRLQDIGIEVHVFNLSKWNFALQLINIFNFLNKIRPACVHCWMYHGNLIGGAVAKLSGIKNIIWSIHHLDVNRKSLSFSSYIASKLGGFFSSVIPHKIIYVSQASMDEHTINGYHNGNNLLINNFVDTESFFPSVEKRSFMRSKFNIDSDVFVVGCVARWNTCKGHKYLFAALNKLKRQGRDFCCVLIGVGMNPYNENLIQLLTTFDLNENIILMDCVDNVEDVYPMFDMHVLPSVSEAFGLVTIEAMSCGIPVLSSNVGSSFLIINNSEYIYNYDDINLLARRLISRMDNYNDNNSIGLILRARVQEFFSLKSALDNYHIAWFR
ncbi:glycosyltransferase [Paraglaciecola polaris]|uniref:Sulfoquinovosyltransferase n=1 Tax=Paraglaciecola polaris LMG 21857 TaxID=1129793 RepID=K6ZBJ8_9ALTE|nr:glycosyltransferase [Paraglaciecola polaris]GAC33486.1 sulfoquinovosyltransferase [Paraglaciecola polaris LMG 21857]